MLCKHYFRVREINPVYECGWIYVSNPIYSYYRALKEAIRIEKQTGIKNWVELIIVS